MFIFGGTIPLSGRKTMARAYGAMMYNYSLMSCSGGICPCEVTDLAISKKLFLEPN